MKILNKMVSLLAVIAVMPSAFAATSRVAMNVNTTRLPTTRSSLASIYARASLASTGITTSSTLLTAAECVDEYTNCMKGSDACGSEFEECTTNPLLHSKMAQCTSVLYQCSSDGINNLFGTSSVTDLGAVASYKVRKTGKEFTGAIPVGTNDYEVTKFTYPTTNSVMHQLIEGAAIANRFDTTQCVKKYTNCLKKDDVCGEDFELCTDHDEFSKQQVLCASTLARCQNEAIVELFGSSDTTKFSGGRLEKMVKDGADLAGANAVNTCYKTISTCFSAACAKNPYRCVEGTSMAVASAADFVGAGSEEGLATGTGLGEDNTAVLTSSDIKKFFKNACEEKIGGNKYCYMTFHEGKTPKASELSDFDERSELFSEAYSTYKTKLNSNLQDVVTAFDTKAKEACLETIKSCAMRSCGGGVGSVCYTRATVNGDVHINKGRDYTDIKSACAGAVNLDKNCIYAARSMGDTGYSYTFEDSSVFNTLFPEYSSEDTLVDPIGAVEQLNSLLATSYNSAAIAELKKKCQNVAVSCVKSMCGTDYVNCYRNRTDIVGGVYNTGSGSFDRSMNKMGGVLDYNIVVGLCLLNVQNSSYCDEHLKIAASQAFENESAATGWGSGDSMATSVRQGWLNGAGSTTVTANTSQVLTGCTVESASDACDAYTVMPCGTVDEDGCNYSKEQYTDFETYAVNNAGETLFQQVLADVEKEAQAKYNAKLTKEQNVCLSNNTGGLMGNSDNGSNFMWVKLRGKKVPASYTQKGLTDKQFVASNDLYGSFCRVRINVLSDDKEIQEELSKESSGGIAYFAVGDAFTCGSWLSKQSLQRITDKKAEAARKAAGEGSSKDKATMAWSTIGGLLGGGALGVGLTESGVLSKALGNANKKFTSKNSSSGEKVNAKKCVDNTKRAQEAVKKGYFVEADKYAEDAVKACKALLNVDCAAKPDMVTRCYYTNNSEKQYEENFTELQCQELCTKSGGTKTGCNTQYSPEALNRFNAFIEDLGADCQNANDDGNNVSDKSNKALRIAVPIATAAAGAALGIGISKSVLDKKYEQAEQEAIDQWNADVGNHIKCYIGGEELGSYGEIISFDIN